MSTKVTLRLGAVAVCALSGMASLAVADDEAYFALVMPITGYLSVEGASQHNGAVLALDEGIEGVRVRYETFDTGTSTTNSVNALERALNSGDVIAVGATIFGPELLTMMPVGEEYGVPMLTISGTALATESGNPYVFRFLPNDRKIKVAQARYAVEDLGFERPALIGDTTAYGQGGHAHLKETFAALGVEPAYEEIIAFDLRDMTPMLTKVRESQADVLVLHMIAHPMTLIIKQARSMGMDIPIVSSSSLVTPSSTALFEPGELAGICAETPSSPESRATPEIAEWADRYLERFGVEPDGLALAQYDAMKMAMHVVEQGARTAEEMRVGLEEAIYQGIAMTYQFDGKGDMAHDADVVCYDGSDRVPRIARHFSGDELVVE